jgi:hypothetical protein
MITTFTDMTNIHAVERIYANYDGLYTSWDMADICDDLDIKPSQIKQYYVKWDQLVVTYIDDYGVEHQEEVSNPSGGASDYDFKHPSSVEVDYGDGYGVVPDGDTDMIKYKINSLLACLQKAASLADNVQISIPEIHNIIEIVSKKLEAAE